jgi:hypothetical protein
VGALASFVMCAVVVVVAGGAVSFLDACQKMSVVDLTLLMRFSKFLS